MSRLGMHQQNLEGDLASLGSALLDLQIDGRSVLQRRMVCGSTGRVFLVSLAWGKTTPPNEYNMHVHAAQRRIK